MEGLEYTVKLVDQISGPAKKAAESTKGLSGSLDAMTVAMGGWIKDAGEALVGTLADAGKEMVSLAFEASAAKKQMITMFDALGEGVVTGKQIDDMLDDMRGELGVTKDSMAPLVKQFMAMGIASTSALHDMSRAAASANAIMGDPSAGNAYVALQKKIQMAVESGQKLKIPAKGLQSLAEMGLHADDVAGQLGITSKQLTDGLKAGTVDAEKFGQALSDALIKKGKGPLEAASMSLGNLVSLFKENVGDMFEDLSADIAPFLAGLKDMLGIFSQGTDSGKAMKFIVESVFKGAFGIATKILPYIKHLMFDVVIAALKIYIAAKPLVAELKKLFGSADGESVTDALHFMVEFMMNGIIFAVKFYTVMIRLWEGIAGVAGAVVDFAKSGVSIASDFINGLVGGITGGITRVVDSVKNLGTQAVNAVKSTLKIASPSQVMMEMGQHTASGFASGIDAGAPKVASSMAEMSEPPGRGSGPRTGGGNVTVNVYGVKGAEELKEEFPLMLAQAFERLAIMGGA